ncbi:hypothetical protein M569_14180, partial [Genlisea aurea]
AVSCISSSSHVLPTPSSPSPQHQGNIYISLISANGLPELSDSMQTYAAAYVPPNHTKKHLTAIDSRGQVNPRWEDSNQFCFRTDRDSSLVAEIYAVSDPQFRGPDPDRDVLIGTAAVSIGHLIKATPFLSLQVNRPSGSPGGILNLGVDVALDWNANTEAEFPRKPGSVCNGDRDNGSELWSDIGPSASIVAAELSRKRTAAETRRQEDRNGSGGGWQKSSDVDESDGSALSRSETSGLMRRGSSNGSLLACFVCGVEFTVVCGGKTARRRKRLPMSGNPHKA